MFSLLESRHFYRQFGANRDHFKPGAKSETVSGGNQIDVVGEFRVI